jgi:hypothetical protein
MLETISNNEQEAVAVNYAAQGIGTCLAAGRQPG